MRPMFALSTLSFFFMADQAIAQNLGRRALCTLRTREHLLLCCKSFEAAKAAEAAVLLHFRESVVVVNTL